MNGNHAGIRCGVLGGILFVASLLTSCGGGEPIERFVPQRLLVVGDETSVINGDGSKHTVNALVSGTSTLDCRSNPLWVQVLASAYGLEFAECLSSGARVTAQTFGVAGAKVADIAAQVDALGPLASKDLVTMLAGANDILEQYALLDTTVNGVLQTEAVLTASLEATGAAMAAQVNRIANAGGRVLISTVPDLGLTPFAASEETANPGRAALLTRLTKRFNAKLRINIINDGRRIGLLLTDELVQAVIRNPPGNGFSNVNAAACDVVLAPSVTACTSNTLVTGASGDTYLWANDRLLSPGGHRLFGNLAIFRATGNPF
jgi:outer membrane lipase/esterase